MPRHVPVLILFSWLLPAGAAVAGPDPFDLIPEDAAAGLAIRSVSDLKKKGETFLAETQLNLPLRPSQAFDMLFQFLGINAGLDPDRPAALMLVNPKQVGLDKLPMDLTIIDLLVAAIPFDDRDKMAANFGIKAGGLKPDTVVPGKAANFGQYFYARDKHVFLGNNEKAVVAVAKAKSAGAALTAAQRRSLGDADLLLHLGPRTWGKEWKDVLREFERSFGTRTDEAEQQVVRQLVESLESVQSVLISAVVDRGLGLHFLAQFPKDGNESTRKFLTTLQGGPGASSLAGLPDAPAVAAQAARGDGAQTGVVVKLIVHQFLQPFLETRKLVAATDRPVFVGVFAEIWKHLQGSRLAVYPNADEQKLGLFSAVSILDPSDLDKFLAELRQLARYGEGSLDLSDKAAGKDDVATVEKLILQLGDNRFAVRESAFTKLSLIGEPALPYLENALNADDAEVRRRARHLKESIVGAAEARRKELLTKDLTAGVRPTFTFAPKAEERDGWRIETVRIRLSERDAARVPQFRQLLGPDWDKVRLAVHGKQLVVLIGSDQNLLLATLRNLKEGKPGLAASKSLAPFVRHAHAGRKAEFHLSMQTALALLTAGDLKAGVPAGKDAALTSLSLTVEPDRLQLDVWLPSTEVKTLAKQQGW